MVRVLRELRKSRFRAEKELKESQDLRDRLRERLELKERL